MIKMRFPGLNRTAPFLFGCASQFITKSWPAQQLSGLATFNLKGLTINSQQQSKCELNEPQNELGHLNNILTLDLGTS